MDSISGFLASSLSLSRFGILSLSRSHLRAAAGVPSPAPVLPLSLPLKFAFPQI